ncbi:MAG TPA: folylpolyglutamate synthase/dihydrofolate synthase family protein [Ktedonobacteraceae bacterium]|jgi:dihydrofolate synthase/folylpolyglutamate synthase|nr:folylpolyglutamate synthase/dihydrofolate synthase family protein [Ktedonobacteraceae bacterium]
MNYKEALSYLYSLSDFERSGVYTRNREGNLSREELLLEALGNPHTSYGSTLIAGTKGKGSTAAMIERVLREAGWRTGLYTQPDLHTFRERIRINGRLISEEEFAELLPQVRAAVEKIEQTPGAVPYNTYQVATALMFLYFARKQVQHAVLEVGLGGRLDATNVTQPLVSVITSISYDHMQVLGNTLTQIATEKAGIIKSDGVIVTSAQSPEALLAIAAVSRKRNAELVRAGPLENDPAQAEVDAGQLPATSYRYQLEQRFEDRQRFTIWAPEKTYSGLEIPLVGEHQLENATAALAALDNLNKKGVRWDEKALREGLRLVHWPARIEVVGHNPVIVVDGAHNADSMQKLMQALRTSFSWRKLITVLSVNRDKDLVGIVQALAGVDAVVLTRMKNPRGASIEEMRAIFAAQAPNVSVYTSENSNAAMELALSLAESNDLVCATGSLYVAAEVLQWAAARGDKVAREDIHGLDHENG